MPPPGSRNARTPLPPRVRRSAAGDVAAAAAYCRYVIAAVILVGISVLVMAGLAWTARRVHVGTLDALALAEKVATPRPSSALDWPELRVRAVVPQPDEPAELAQPDLAQPDKAAQALLLVEWPAHPQRTSILLVALDRSDRRPLPLLAEWCASRASVSPARYGPTGLELRRRQSLERVYGLLIAEDAGPTSFPSVRPGPDGRRRPTDGQ